MNLNELKDIIKRAGIVGAGGAGFPLYAKLNKGSKYIIVNGAECEPLLHVDQHLMVKYADQLLQTLGLIVEATGAEIGIIGLKAKYEKSIRALELANTAYPNIRVQELSNSYPAGDEVTLIQECTGRVVSKGALPMTKEVIVLNVETLLNVWQVLSNGMPVTHTYVTIGGDIPVAQTLRIPIGMTVEEVIRLSGREDLDGYSIVMGGPMMGSLVSPKDLVTKTTKALLVLEDDHYVIRRKRPTNYDSLRKIMSSCSQCRMCTDLCPRYTLGHKVEPHKLMNAVANGLVNHSEACQTALGCCGCNLCSLYACHHELDPAGFMMKIKKELLAAGIKPDSTKEAKADDWIDYRKVPTSRLIRKLDLARYDVEAPLDERPIDTSYVTIPLKQHIGASAKACVQKGDKVTLGELIAKVKDSDLGADIHSSISGIIKEITDDMIIIERGI